MTEWIGNSAGLLELSSCELSSLYYSNANPVAFRRSWIKAARGGGAGGEEDSEILLVQGR